MVVQDIKQYIIIQSICVSLFECVRPFFCFTALLITLCSPLYNDPVPRNINKRNTRNTPDQNRPGYLT